MTFQISRRPLVAAVVALLALAACGGTESADSRVEQEPSQVPLVEVTGDESAVKVGVLAIRSAVAANAQYGPIVEYLQADLDRSFELVPLGQEELFEAVENEAVDFVLSNPLSSVQLRRLYGVEFLATLSRSATGTEFGGLIIARADSEVDTLDDLRGATVTCVAFETAAAGCNFQILHLRDAGITPDDFAEFTETPSQDNIVLAVLNGDVDVGFIRTGQLERMVGEGTLRSLDELRILDPMASDYVHPHTTRLYPEWPFGSLPDTPDDLVDQVRTSLLAIPSDDPALQNANAAGFVTPEDYGPLDELIIELQLRSWDAPG